MSSKIANALRTVYSQSNMSRQVTIETPFPSLAETARILGVSPAEAERVQRMITEHKPRRRARTNGHRAALRYARKKASKKR